VADLQNSNNSHRESITRDDRNM